MRRRFPTLPFSILLAALLPVVWAIGGCGGKDDAPRATLLDLLAALPTADRWSEPATLALGDPASHGHLVSGWLPGEPAAAGEGTGQGDEAGGFVWAAGERSVLRFFVARPRPLAVSFRVAPPRYLAEQRLTVELSNGLLASVDAASVEQASVDAASDEQASVEVARLDLEAGVRSYRVALPAELLAAGENRLILRHARAQSPLAAGVSADPRPLAAAWYRVSFSPEGSEELPVAEPPASGPPTEGPPTEGPPTEGPPTEGPRVEGPALHLPAGSRVDYFLELPPGLTAPEVALELSGLRLAPAASADDVGASARHGRLAVDVALQAAEGVRANGMGAASERIAELPVAAAGSRDRRRIPLRPPPAGGGLAAGPDTGQLLRLSLSALPAASAAGEQAEHGGADLLLLKPRLVAPVDRLPPAPQPAKPQPTAAGQPAPPPAAPSRRPNLLIYMIDTLRADRLGCYRRPATPGYQRPTTLTPNLDAFAAGGVLFEDAISPSPWTRPAVASLFTGLGPRSHGVHGRRDALGGEPATLAELLSAAGYRTGAVVTNGNVARAFGFGRGFDSYRELPQRRNRSGAVNREAAAWLDRWLGEAGEGDDRQPFFLYLHTVDPHAPYDPPPPFRDRFAADVPDDLVAGRRLFRALHSGRRQPDARLIAHLAALYDAEVAANDASFGRLLELLDERGLADDTAVVVLSDHGEELYEHGGFEHGRTLHAEILEVPLLLRLPGTGGALDGRRIADPVGLTDLPPTLLAYLGLAVPGEMEGRNLWPALAAALRGDADGRAAQLGPPAEVHSYLDLDGRTGAAVSGAAYRLIDPRSLAAGAGRRLYDRRADPRELTDLAARLPLEAGRLATLIRLHELGLGRRLTAGEARLDRELEEQLRALGYLD